MQHLDLQCTFGAVTQRNLHPGRIRLSFGPLVDPLLLSICRRRGFRGYFVKFEDGETMCAEGEKSSGCEPSLACNCSSEYRSSLPRSSNIPASRRRIRRRQELLGQLAEPMAVILLGGVVFTMCLGVFVPLLKMILSSA